MNKFTDMSKLFTNKKDAAYSAQPNCFGRNNVRKKLPLPPQSMANLAPDSNGCYWQHFYKSTEVNKLTEHSDFARFFYEYVKSHCDKSQLLLELGCGNGRDTKFFIENGINVRAVDANATNELDCFIRGDAIENLVTADYYYLRFFTHAVPEEYLDKLLLKISELAEEDALVFIETRSSKGVTNTEKSIVEFTSPIGDIHPRYLYSYQYFKLKLEQNFDLIYTEESTGFAVFGEEDPWIIRAIIKPRVVVKY